MSNIKETESELFVLRAPETGPYGDKIHVPDSPEDYVRERIMAATRRNKDRLAASIRDMRRTVQRDTEALTRLLGQSAGMRRLTAKRLTEITELQFRAMSAGKWTGKPVLDLTHTRPALDFPVEFVCGPMRYTMAIRVKLDPALPMPKFTCGRLYDRFGDLVKSRDVPFHPYVDMGSQDVCGSVGSEWAFCSGTAMESLEEKGRSGNYFGAVEETLNVLTTPPDGSNPPFHDMSRFITARKCTACSHRWSMDYTRSVNCPECGHNEGVGLFAELPLRTAPNPGRHREECDSCGDGGEIRRVEIVGLETVNIEFDSPDGVGSVVVREDNQRLCQGCDDEQSTCSYCDRACLGFSTIGEPRVICAGCLQEEGSWQICLWCRRVAMLGEGVAPLRLVSFTHGRTVSPDGEGRRIYSRVCSDECLRGTRSAYPSAREEVEN